MKHVLCLLCTMALVQALSEESARLAVQHEQLAAQQQQVAVAALRASNGGGSPSAAAAVAARAASLATREAQLLQQQQELTERERYIAQVCLLQPAQTWLAWHLICLRGIQRQALQFMLQSYTYR